MRNESNSSRLGITASEEGNFATDRARAVTICHEGILPMRGVACLFLLLSSSLVSGCLAKAAADVVTAPVRIASKAVDLATTSQSERDEARGRELRETEEQLGQLERRYFKQREACRDGDQDACAKARETYSEMQQLSRALPPPRDQTDQPE